MCKFGIYSLVIRLELKSLFWFFYYNGFIAAHENRKREWEGERKSIDGRKTAHKHFPPISAWFSEYVCILLTHSDYIYHTIVITSVSVSECVSAVDAFLPSFLVCYVRFFFRTSTMGWSHSTSARCSLTSISDAMLIEKKKTLPWNFLNNNSEKSKRKHLIMWSIHCNIRYIYVSIGMKYRPDFFPWRSDVWYFTIV